MKILDKLTKSKVGDFNVLQAALFLFFSFASMMFIGRFAKKNGYGGKYTKKEMGEPVDTAPLEEQTDVDPANGMAGRYMVRPNYGGRY